MQQRWKQIVKLVNQTGFASVNDLSAALNVSEVTIRKDLNELEKRGHLIRTHGGASVNNESNVPSFFSRVKIEMDEKQSIGKKAASLIEEGESVLIDAGSTPLMAAKFLKHKKVSIVTNSLPVGMELSDYHGTVSITGGDLLTTSMGLYGPDTEKYLDSIQVNKLILGASGIQLERGVTTSSSIEAAVKQKMIRSAQEVILVVDHTKFTKIKIALFASFADIHTIVTSTKAPAQAVEKLKSYGVKVLLVDPDPLLDEL